VTGVNADKRHSVKYISGLLIGCSLLVMSFYDYW